MMLKSLRASLIGLALLSLLLTPLLQPPLGASLQSAFCGVGKTQSALALKMQRVAPPELLAYLGVPEASGKHCPLCYLAAATAVALLLVLGWQYLASGGGLLRAVSARPWSGRPWRACLSRGPPQTPIFN